MKHCVMLFVTYVFITHCTAFILELIYQKYCYPTNIFGFFYILFTHDNHICLHIRKTSLLLHSLISNLMISSVSFSFITIQKFFRDFQVKI